MQSSVSASRPYASVDISLMMVWSQDLLYNVVMYLDAFWRDGDLNRSSSGKVLPPKDKMTLKRLMTSKTP